MPLYSSQLPLFLLTECLNRPWKCADLQRPCGGDPATNTPLLIPILAWNKRLLDAYSSPRHEMQDQKNQADDEQYVE